MLGCPKHYESVAYTAQSQVSASFDKRFLKGFDNVLAECLGLGNAY